MRHKKKHLSGSRIQQRPALAMEHLECRKMFSVTYFEQDQVFATDPQFEPEEHAWFGNAIAVDEDTMVVGSRFENSNAGAAYVYTRNDGGTPLDTSDDFWQPQAKLTSSNVDAFDEFGASVAIEGDTIVVGSTWDDEAALNSGSAHVFTRRDGTWSKRAILTADDAAAGDGFGVSVSISGDTVVVGSFQDTNFGHTNDDVGKTINGAGSVYVFVGNGDDWSLQAKLIASDAEAYDAFGTSVSISGESVVVGSPEDDAEGGNSGSAYVFTRTGSSWNEQEKLNSDKQRSNDGFGTAVAISGNTVVVGSPRDYHVVQNVVYTESGSAYVFTRSGSGWNEHEKLTAPIARTNDAFGTSVSISGNSIVVGSPGDDDAGTDSGAAYVFIGKRGNWSQQAKLTASDAANSDGFGNSVSVAGKSIAVGSYLDDVIDAGPTFTNAGSAYVFVQMGTFPAEVAVGVDASYDGLYTINLATGEVSEIGKLHPDDDRYTTPVSMAIRPSDNTIFVVNNSPSQDRGLSIVDRATGRATHIGGSTQMQSITFDDADNLYGLLGGKLATIDLATGEVTSLGGDSLGAVFALDYNWVDGDIYGLNIGSSESNATLLRISTSGKLLSSIPLDKVTGVTGSMVFDAQGNLTISNIHRQLFDVDTATGEVSNPRTAERSPQGMGFIADTLAGDVNGDGKVNFRDFLIMSENFGTNVASRGEGDLDGDRQVQFSDFLILSANFGRKLESSVARAVDTVFHEFGEYADDSNSREDLYDGSRSAQVSLTCKDGCTSIF